MKVHIDSIRFKHKPTDEEVKGIKHRLANTDTIRDITIEDIADALQNGQTIQPGITPFSEKSRLNGKKGNCSDDFLLQCVFMNDHDNKRNDVRKETPVYVSEVLSRYNLTPAFIYPTFNSTAENERFRSVIVCEEDITDKDERDAIQAALIKLFPQSDKICSTAERLFFGTDKKIYEGIGSLNAVCKKADLLALAEAMETVNSTRNEKSESEQPKIKFGETIPVGVRHGTLLSFAVTVLKKYGTDDSKAHELYMQRVAQCEEPKPDAEIETIWNDACKYYEKTIQKSSEYISPEDYNGPDDFTDLSEPPIPFEEIKRSAFPVETLPKRIRSYVEAVAESTQTPVDMPATASLTVVSSCMQGKYVVKAKADWVEPVNIDALIVAEPSERKSAVTSLSVKPMNSFEMEYNKQHAASLERNRMQKRILEKRQKAIEDKFAKGKADTTELDAIANEISSFEEQSPMQLYVDDVTPEKLVSVMVQNKGVASIISAEGGIFDQLAGGMYSKAVNIDVFLKGHSGDTIRIDRIGRNSESVEHPALTMLLAVQPSVLAGLMQNETFRGRGLTARFLYTIPTSRVGTRKYRTEAIPQDVQRDYSDLIYNLLDEESNPAVGTPEVITLSAEADIALEEYADEIESKLTTEYADFADWAGKLCGAVVRISGLLTRAEHTRTGEFLEEPKPLVVDGDTMKNAIKIGRYFTEHARAAYQLMGADKVVQQCKYVLKAIRNTGATELTKRDIMRMCRSIKRAEDLQLVLDRLCEHGYLAPKSDEEQNNRGRPASQTYSVNLALYAS